MNNVGVNTRKKVFEGNNEDFTFVMNTNVHSALNLCRLCHPYLKESDSASIIFNSSVAGGPTAMKSGIVYAMSKGLPSTPTWRCSPAALTRFPLRYCSPAALGGARRRPQEGRADGLSHLQRRADTHACAPKPVV